MKICYAGIAFGSRMGDIDEVVKGEIDEVPESIDGLGDKFKRRLKYSDWSDEGCEGLMKTFDDGKVRFSMGEDAIVVIGVSPRYVRAKLADLYLSTLEE